MSKPNVWLLSEERPKAKVIVQIVKHLFDIREIPYNISEIQFVPIINDGKFDFRYEVRGITSKAIERVYLETISGNSSFVDYLVFLQEDRPKAKDTPSLVIEETKTDDSESRNTGVFQRASKFVYASTVFPGVEQIMLYNLAVIEKEKPSDTNVFGSRCLSTLGVKILGKKNGSVDGAWKNIAEMIAFKGRMRAPPAGNVPVSIKLINGEIHLTGRLYKSNALSHDPNIGAISLMAATVRRLGHRGKIVLSEHGLVQNHLTGKNKFVFLANLLGIELAGLTLPPAIKKDYWKYERSGEKLATIFLHLIVEQYTAGKSIFENHAGCEKGYFEDKEGNCRPLEKYTDKVAYKAGNKSKIYAIPDLILRDDRRKTIISIEGKKYVNRENAIEETKAFYDVESTYIADAYPDYDTLRSVALYGSKETTIVEKEVGFLLNDDGIFTVGSDAPALFKQAVRELKKENSET